MLPGELGGGIGRKRQEEVRLAADVAGLVAVGGGAAGVDDAADPGVAGRQEDALVPVAQIWCIVSGSAMD